jgi:hypothetical protein
MAFIRDIKWTHEKILELLRVGFKTMRFIERDELPNQVTSTWLVHQESELEELNEKHQEEEEYEWERLLLAFQTSQNVVSNVEQSI